MLPFSRRIWAVGLFALTAACGGTSIPAVPTSDPTNLTIASGAAVGVAADEIASGEVASAVASDTAPSALLAVQRDASRILDFVQADGFAAPPMAFDALPNGSASYRGVMTVGYEDTALYGGAAGQLALTASFGADATLRGTVENFVYVPGTATLLENPIGARSVPGALSLSGAVRNVAASGAATAIIPVDVSGTVVLPIGEFDFSDDNAVDLRGTLRGRVADGAIVLDGSAVSTRGEPLILSGIGVQ